MIEKRIRLSELGDSAARIAHDLGLSVQAEVPLVKRAYVGKSVEVEDDLIHAVVSSMRRPDLEGETVDLNFLVMLVEYDRVEFKNVSPQIVDFHNFIVKVPALAGDNSMD